MRYYLHDSNSFNDEKITELYIKFGYEGLGLFYTTLEKLAMQEKPVSTEVLKHQLKVGKRLNKCWSFMESLGILSSNNGETFNKQLLKFSEKYQIKKEKNRIKISEWRKNQDVTENVTSYVPVRNHPKDNISKVKIIDKGIPLISAFLLYAKTIKIYHSSFDFQIENKYDSWVSNNWKDGNDKEIKNWKNKLASTMVYFKKENLRVQKNPWMP